MRTTGVMFPEIGIAVAPADRCLPILGDAFMQYRRELHKLRRPAGRIP
jgi:hypothetical protein